MATPPQFIPNDAPFTPEQRAWLNDFFARTFPNMVPAPTAPTTAPVAVTLLWGSQTGNAEACAKKMVKTFAQGNFKAESFDLADYDTGRLKSEEHVLVITSTYGDGEPPDNAADFYDWLLSDEASSMDGVKFSVLGLGDSEYPDFCECAKVIDKRFKELGAECLYERVDCDVDFEAPFKKWREGVLSILGAAQPAGGRNVMLEVEAEDEGYSKKKPFSASVLANQNLNGEGSPKQTHHIEISLEGSGLEYEVGDALGVYPCNPESVVEEILAGLPFNTNMEVPLPDGGESPLFEALLHHYDIRSINRKFLEMWQSRSGSPYLRAVVESKDKDTIEAFILGRELVDLVIDFPADFSDGEDFVGVLKKLQPRLYSIASSPKAHPGEVHLTVGLVAYEAHRRAREGVCSSFLAKRSESSKPGVYVHKNKAFRLPESEEAPIIMVGPGTGIAPFRAFLEERREAKATGKNWLFFGNPYRATDYLYEQELKEMKESGVLSRLDLAFSRDQEHKIYVQDKMKEAKEELWLWLEQGAYFYVCGDATYMAKDVDAALHEVAADAGGLGEEGAVQYVKKLRKEKRYLRDVY